METDSYRAYLSARGPYLTGEQGSLTAVVTAKSPFKCNADYPAKFVGGATSGVRWLSEATGGSLSGERGSLTIPVQVERRGPAMASGRLKFSVCSADVCLLEEERLSVSFDVE